MRGATKRAAACSAAFCLAMGGIPLAACRLLPAGLPAGASAAAVYLIALAVGLHSIPKLADAMLARKLEGWLDWFDRGAAAYSAWRGKEPIREPNPGSKYSDERRLAAWRKDVATQAASGSLPRELFDKAAAAGVPFAESIDPASLPGMDALEAKYGPSASAAPARRCALGLALCLVVTSGSAWVVGLLRGIPGAGGGDRRLAPALAAACGMPGAAVFMLASYALYLASAAPSLIRRRATLSTRAPLGLWLLVGLGCGLSVLNGGIDWLGLGIAR